jgi:RimJ/RimL family protein N-acetyltransferase
MPGPAYRVVTERLVIRCYNPADVYLLQQAVSDSVEHLKPFMPWAESSAAETLDVKLERLRQLRGKFDLGQDFIYGIFSQDESLFIGGTGLHTRVGDNAREIGYWIHKDYLRKGYATEVSAALTKVAFEVDNMERVEIHCSVTNHASAAVPRKLGYIHETTRRRLSYTREGPQDSMIWTLFKDEYPQTPSARANIAAFDAIGRKIF